MQTFSQKLQIVPATTNRIYLWASSAHDYYCLLPPLIGQASHMRERNQEVLVAGEHVEGGGIHLHPTSALSYMDVLYLVG